MGGFEDQRLVCAARSGNDRAFAQLVARHYPALLRSCERMLAGQDLAGDAAQEATLRAMLGLGHLRDESRFGSWLIGIGLNVCRGLLTGGRRLVSLDALRDRTAAVESASEDPEPVELITADELATRVREAISALPAGQREAVAMFYLSGLTQAEIAEELATRPGAVKTRLHKARRSLRASLHDTYREYIDVTEQTPQLIPMRLAELLRAHTQEPDIQRHIMFLEDDQGRRLPIWIGQAEATAMALILGQVELPRPGVYQFAASLLAAAGASLREVRVTELTESTFYAEAILTDQTRIDARPSDALTLALVTGAPIYVSAAVLKRAEQTSGKYRDLIEEANAATDNAQVIAQEAVAAHAAVLAAVAKPAD